jgi:hypothetical protein
VVRKVKVQLFGRQNRFTHVDPDATQGAVVGKNLVWPSGQLVEPSQFGGGTTVTSDPNTPSLTLWELILNIPSIIKDFVALTGPGYLYHNGTTVGSHEHPLHDIRVEALEVLTIPANKQYILWQGITVEGELTIETGGELVLLDDGLPEPTSPDFTFNVGGELTQVDYDGGEQKVFTYNGSGDLIRVDYIRDGLTLRKDFTYTGGGDLDFITETYV